MPKGSCLMLSEALDSRRVELDTSGEPKHLSLLSKAGLLPEADAAQQFGEARVGAQTIPPRVELQPNQPVSPLRVAFVQPGERLIVFSQTCVYERDRVGRHIFMLGEFFQFPEDLERFPAL